MRTTIEIEILFPDGMNEINTKQIAVALNGWHLLDPKIKKLVLEAMK